MEIPSNVDMPLENIPTFGTGTKVKIVARSGWKKRKKGAGGDAKSSTCNIKTNTTVDNIIKDPAKISKASSFFSSSTRHPAIPKPTLIRTRGRTKEINGTSSIVMVCDGKFFELI